MKLLKQYSVFSISYFKLKFFYNLSLFAHCSHMQIACWYFRFVWSVSRLGSICGTPLACCPPAASCPIQVAAISSVVSVVTNLFVYFLSPGPATTPVIVARCRRQPGRMSSGRVAQCRLCPVPCFLCILPCPVQWWLGARLGSASLVALFTFTAPAHWTHKQLYHGARGCKQVAAAHCATQHVVLATRRTQQTVAAAGREGGWQWVRRRLDSFGIYRLVLDMRIVAAVAAAVAAAGRHIEGNSFWCRHNNCEWGDARRGMRVKKYLLRVQNVPVLRAKRLITFY